MIGPYTWYLKHCDLSETSLKFTSGLELEFVIVMGIRESNLLTHVLKNLSTELFFAGMISQMTNFCPCVSPLVSASQLLRGQVIQMTKGPFTLEENQNPKNLGFLLYSLHCQKNP